MIVLRSFVLVVVLLGSMSQVAVSLAETVQVQTIPLGSSAGSQPGGVPNSFSWNSYFAGANYTTSVKNQGSITLHGRVLRIVSAFEDSLIVSYVTISVTRIVSGPASLAGAQIILKHIGGEVNGITLWQSDQPYFAIGEEVQIEVRQQGRIYVAVSPKTTLESPPNVFATAAGYKLMWYKPGVGWQTSTSRPGSDWYGPAKWSAGSFSYWINTAGIPADVSSSSFITYARAAFQTWEDDAGSTVDFTYQGTTSAAAGTEDSVNTVGWASIGGSTIAVCTVWGSYSSGDYNSLRIVETDIRFDSSKS